MLLIYKFIIRTLKFFDHFQICKTLEIKMKLPFELKSIFAFIKASVRDYAIQVMKNHRKMLMI